MIKILEGENGIEEKINLVISRVIKRRKVRNIKKKYILPVVLYRRENFSLTFSDEYRLEAV